MSVYCAFNSFWRVSASCNSSNAAKFTAPILLSLLENSFTCCDNSFSPKWWLSFFNAAKSASRSIKRALCCSAISCACCTAKTAFSRCFCCSGSRIESSSALCLTSSNVFLRSFCSFCTFDKLFSIFVYSFSNWFNLAFCFSSLSVSSSLFSNANSCCFLSKTDKRFFKWFSSFCNEFNCCSTSFNANSAWFAFLSISIIFSCDWLNLIFNLSTCSSITKFSSSKIVNSSVYCSISSVKRWLSEFNKSICCLFSCCSFSFSTRRCCCTCNSVLMRIKLFCSCCNCVKIFWLSFFISIIFWLISSNSSFRLPEFNSNASIFGNSRFFSSFNSFNRFCRCNNCSLSLPPNSDTPMRLIWCPSGVTNEWFSGSHAWYCKAVLKFSTHHTPSNQCPMTFEKGGSASIFSTKRSGCLKPCSSILSKSCKLFSGSLKSVWSISWLIHTAFVLSVWLLKSTVKSGA